MYQKAIVAGLCILIAIMLVSCSKEMKRNSRGKFNYALKFNTHKKYWKDASYYSKQKFCREMLRNLSGKVVGIEKIHDFSVCKCMDDVHEKPVEIVNEYFGSNENPNILGTRATICIISLLK